MVNNARGGRKLPVQKRRFIFEMCNRAILYRWMLIYSLMMIKSFHGSASHENSGFPRNTMEISSRFFQARSRNQIFESPAADQNSVEKKIRFVWPNNGTAVTAQRGSTANLPCHVENLADGLVTWFRRKDYHLLTVGHTLYSSDERFFVRRPPRALTKVEDWSLQIRYVQERDAGLYECQLSTHPPNSLFIELHVVEAVAEIDGGPEKYVKSGSTLHLTCNIRQSSVAADFVFWYHDDRMINYEEWRGVQVMASPTSSTLRISKAQTSHSGNYTCVPSNARPYSIIVHILNGEKPAAMQHSSSVRDRSWHFIPILCFLTVIILL